MQSRSYRRQTPQYPHPEWIKLLKIANTSLFFLRLNENHMRIVPHKRQTARVNMILLIRRADVVNLATDAPACDNQKCGPTEQGSSSPVHTKIPLSVVTHISHSPATPPTEYRPVSSRSISAMQSGRPTATPSRHSPLCVTLQPSATNVREAVARGNGCCRCLQPSGRNGGKVAVRTKLRQCLYCAFRHHGGEIGGKRAVNIKKEVFFVHVKPSITECRVESHKRVESGDWRMKRT